MEANFARVVFGEQDAGKPLMTNSPPFHELRHMRINQ